jgi:Na+/H+ antiporter NhaD/arsenite permease-like protein
MILAGWTGMTFNDFFFYKGKPSIFFAVEAGALASFVVLYFFFRRYRQPVGEVEVEKVISWVPTYMLVGLMVALAVSSFVDPGFGYAAGTICMVFGVAGVVWNKARNGDSMRLFVSGLDWNTTLFLMGIFVVVSGLVAAGWIDTIAGFMKHASSNDPMTAFVLVVFLSVIFSAFIDNVPYLLAMIPVSQQIGQDIHGSPTLVLFGLLVGACLGGNITPVGASANIVAVGLLRKRGVQVGFMEFVRIGLPFTIAAVVVSSIFLWVVWG